MAQFLKQMVLFGVALPSTLVGYHLYAGAHGSELMAEGGDLVQALDRFHPRPGYRLSDLAILEKDLWYVETRYVEQQRLNPEQMFQSALEAVEREVPEVLFQREPGGRRLHMAVGRHSTVLVLEPIDSFASLNRELRRVAAVLEDKLSPEIEHPDVEYALVNGALSTLDPHTILMPPEAAREMEVDNEGEFGGLGIEITIVDGLLTIKEPIDGTPAAKARLQRDDQIVRIEDESTINMDLEDAVSKLRGPVGAPVNIKVMRKGFDAPRPYTIIRDVIRVNPVEGQLLPGDIAYLRIKSFHEKVDDDVAALLTELHAKAPNGLEGLVLDLRSNPGGYLNQAVDVADRFVSSGVIVSTVEGGRGRRDQRRAEASGTEPSYPIAVLVNGSSASASEIVAGALRNLDRAVIIGERTFGKGSVQHLYDNDDDSRLKLTVAKYLTPGDESIQSVGIPPDILLQPSVVQRSKEKDELPVISLYWREWVSREADLDHHLEHVADSAQEPVYRLRYLRPERDDEESEDPDPKDDWEVQFASDVLSGARGERRAEILASVADVVSRYEAREQKRIAEAFQTLGLDWSATTAPADVRASGAPQLDVRLDLGADGVLRAGEEESVILEVTNRGDRPLLRLSATTTSDNAWLDHREFYFGRVDPGETARYTQRVVLPDGYGAELAPVKIGFRDADSPNLSEHTVLARTTGRSLPRFAYQVDLRDGGTPGSRGNGNGLPEVGETVEIVVTVKNTGDGPSREAFARLKNRSGRHLDLQVGSIDLGELRDDGGASCDEQADGCARTLRAGESSTATLSFELRSQPDAGGWDVELLVGDSRAYDYAAIQRGGFYDYFQLSETLTLSPDQPIDEGLRQPPTIEVTRRPGLEADAPGAVLSGKVTDDDGLRDVMVFRGEDKIFFEGGEDGTRTLPFTVDDQLEPGANLFVVLARDARGLSATSTFSTWYGTGVATKQGSTAQSAVEPVPPPSGTAPTVR